MKYTLNKTIVEMQRFGICNIINQVDGYTVELENNNIIDMRKKRDDYLRARTCGHAYINKPLKLIDSTKHAYEFHRDGDIHKYSGNIKASGAFNRLQKILPDNTFTISNDIELLKKSFTRTSIISDQRSFYKYLSNEENVKKLKLIGIYNQWVENYTVDDDFFDIIRRGTSMKTSGVGLLSSMFRYGSDSSMLLVYEAVGDDLLIVVNPALSFLPTEVSCGLTQVHNVNSYFNYLDNLKESKCYSFIELLQDDIVKALPNFSLGAQLLLSTKKSDIVRYKPYWLKLTNAFKNITRYSFNNNSGNDIGTTLLMLR